MCFSSSANYHGHRRPTAWAWSLGVRGVFLVTMLNFVSHHVVYVDAIC